MATDATGTPTSLGIPTFNTAVDAPTGNGFNAAMASIDTLIAGRVSAPASIAVGEAPIWNGAAWVRSTTQPLGIASLAGYPSNAAKALRGDGTWATPGGYEIGYDQITASVNITGLTTGTATTVITAGSYTFDGAPVMLEFYTPELDTTSVLGENTWLQVNEGATVIGQIARIIPNANAAISLPICARLRLQPSAGAHTYSIRAYASSTTGVPRVACGTGGGGLEPAFMRFTKA